MLIYVVLSCLFVATLWTPAGKGLTSWLSWFCVLSLSQNMSWSTSESRARLQGWRYETGLSPTVKYVYFIVFSKAILLLWIFYVFFCLVFAMPLCASVYMCLVVICRERADLLAIM